LLLAQAHGQEFYLRGNTLVARQTARIGTDGGVQRLGVGSTSTQSINNAHYARMAVALDQPIEP
jgi:hypothetical protein